MQALLCIPDVQMIIEERAVSLTPQHSTSQCSPFALPGRIFAFGQNILAVRMKFFSLFVSASKLLFSCHDTNCVNGPSKIITEMMKKCKPNTHSTMLGLQFCFHIHLHICWC